MLTDDEKKRFRQQLQKKEDYEDEKADFERPKRRRQKLWNMLLLLAGVLVPVLAIAAVLAVALMNHPFFAN